MKGVSRDKLVVILHHIMSICGVANESVDVPFFLAFLAPCDEYLSFFVIHTRAPGLVDRMSASRRVDPYLLCVILCERDQGASRHPIK